MNPPAPINTHASPQHDLRRESSNATRTIQFRRGKHRWAITCSDEDRGTLLLDLLDMAEDPGNPLGSLDVDLIARMFRDRPTSPTRSSATLDDSHHASLVSAEHPGSQS